MTTRKIELGEWTVAYDSVTKPVTPASKVEAPKKEGYKLDAGKPPASLLPGVALLEVSKVLEFGARKYAAHSWREHAGAWSRMASAGMRHMLSYISGERKDPETGLSHLAHAAACILFLLEYETLSRGFDDMWNDEKKAP